MVNDFLSKIWKGLKKTLILNGIDLLFFAIFFIFFFVYFFVWNSIDLTNVNIDKGFIAFWASLFTISGLLITIHRQISLEGKLDIHNTAVVQTNIRICYGLIDDILVLVNNEQTDYRSVNLLRERIEVHLHYCQKCCPNEKEEIYFIKAKGLNTWQSELRVKTKNANYLFDDIGFIGFIKSLKTFLIKEDQLSFKM